MDTNHENLEIDNTDNGQDDVECGHCTHRKKERTEKEHRDMVNRLSRIEGQIRGIKGMVEKDAYCTDILTQTAAVSAALNSFSRTLLADHITTCVKQDIQEGRDESVEELAEMIKRFMK